MNFSCGKVRSGPQVRFRRPKKPSEEWVISKKCPICGAAARWDGNIIEGQWVYRKVCMMGHSEEIPDSMLPEELICA